MEKHFAASLFAATNTFCGDLIYFGREINQPFFSRKLKYYKKLLAAPSVRRKKAAWKVKHRILFFCLLVYI